MLTNKMERVTIKYELDRMIVSEGMFHYYHAFPIAKYGYEEYMPYLCNLDYVMFRVLGAPLYGYHQLRQPALY